MDCSRHALIGLICSLCRSNNSFTVLNPKRGFNQLSATLTSSGGSEGAPPTAQIVLDFMQFFGKFDIIICLHPLEGRRPLLQGILDLAQNVLYACITLSSSKRK